VAKKPAHAIKSPRLRNRATLNTSGKPVTKPVASPAMPTATTPGSTATSGPVSNDTGMQATTMARFSDEGAAVSQLQSTATPDLGYDDRPLDQVDDQQVPQYIYATSAPLIAVGNPRA
jgi:hypothetical protein